MLHLLDRLVAHRVVCPLAPSIAQMLSPITSTQHHGAIYAVPCLLPERGEPPAAPSLTPDPKVPHVCTLRFQPGDGRGGGGGGAGGGRSVRAAENEGQDVLPSAVWSQLVSRCLTGAQLLSADGAPPPVLSRDWMHLTLGSSTMLELRRFASAPPLVSVTIWAHEPTVVAE